MPASSIFEVSFDHLTDPDRDHVKLRDIMGHTVVLIASEYVAAMETANGTTDCLIVDVHDITDERSYYDQLIVSRVIVNGLKDKIGVPVLGVVARGDSKRGETGPLILRPATDGGRERATEYVRRLEAEASAS